MKQLTKWARHRDRLVLSLIAVALLVVAPSLRRGRGRRRSGRTLIDPARVLERERRNAIIPKPSITARLWQNLLTTYLSSHPSGVNRFDYAALKALKR